MVEGRTLPACVTAIADTGVKLDICRYSGMATLGIAPPDTMHRPPAIFIHGGGYVSFSAYSSLFASAPIACALARPILSLDYPLAPHAHFDSIVPATADAITAIIAEHGSVAIIGDSAGGGLALAAYQQLDEARAREVSAIVLLSPWVALSDAGATHKSHRERDPILRYAPGLSAAAAAYAPDNIDHPMASPLHGDFSRRYPPCLLIAGSEEILRADIEALASKLGQRANIEIHQALFHSFATLAPAAPEARAVHARIRDFIDSCCPD